MSGKNLTFKLIMDADTKGFVGNIKQSEDAAKSVFSAIKQESERLKQATTDASKEMGNIIPKGTSELADKLSQSLNAATGIIKDAGDNAKSTAGNFTDFGNKAEKALGQLKGDLAQAKQNLEAFSKTKASPADIEKAQVQVDQLEKEVQQADQAFSGFQAEVGKANTNLKETDTAAQTAKKGLDGAKFAVSALVGAMAALGIGLGLRELAQAADTYTNLSVQIQIATRDGGDFTSAMAGVQQVALATNSSLDATAGLFTRLNTVGKEMGMTQQQALDLTKTVTQAIQIGGGSAQASEAAVQQFIQAMQGGVLRGEEFNSIMENGYGLAEALAKGLGVTTGELRKMAENGELSAERVIKAVGSQADAIQETYNQFPTTISNALQRIATSWQIVIGEMDQANGSSATVADALVMVADNLGIIKVFLDDIGLGFASLIGDLQGGIDASTIDAFKSAISSAYDAVKDLVATVYEFGTDVIDIVGTSLTNALSIFSSFTGGVTEAGEQVSFLERIFQGLGITFGFISDGATAIKIALSLLTGGFFDLASAANSVMAALTWGDVSKQFAANADLMKDKAKQYYAEADREAQEFQSKGLQRLAEAAQTQAEKDAESVASSKAKLDQLLADQQAEVNGKKATESEKLSAVQAYAEAAIAANKGVMDGVMQADLLTKGYIVTLNQSGKVAVEAWSKSEGGAEKSAASADKARKAATALGLDLDVSLNRISAKFKESESQLDNFAQGLEKLGIEGKQAANVTYEAWLKWLETAKSQAEIDAAKVKLKEFGDQGQISTSQVEQGLIAVKLQAQKLPDDIDPVTEAFKRLGIQTKENLKLAAQQALMDYITIRDSGKATAEGIEKAYEKAAQAAAASGDAGVIASTNAANAGRNLEVQIDATGKASVKSMDEWSKANDRVRDSAHGIGDGYRQAGQVAREEAQSA
ncbi:tape measure protein, partial [Acinetobacter sp. BSP-28]|uniref:tape measure protein n=1 Tax=Acinetobacter sp. BSP-28 TaxID=3344661 RepID=UPI00377008EC